jgi:CBS-domain-containing membrane protein
MKRTFHGMLEEFRLYWKHYVFQSLFAALTISVVLLFLNLQNAIIIASIGSTAFIIFAMPNSVTAKPRNVIGGQLVGFFSGALCSLIPHSLFWQEITVYTLAVGLSIFIMVIIDTEHAPASGTALGVAITGFSLSALIGLLSSVIVLSLVHHFFKPCLRDLI